MKHIIKISIISILFLLACNEQQENSQKNIDSEITSKDKQTLHHIKEVLWSKAYREQDTVLLDQILDESFEFIDGSGNRFTKKDELH